MRMQGPRLSVAVPGALPYVQRSNALGCAILVPLEERTVGNDQYIFAANVCHDVCTASMQRGAKESCRYEVKLM
jgi:hypothetical protein